MEVIKNNKEWLGQWFESFSTWQSHLSSENRLISVRIFGAPLMLWNDQGFSKFTALVGKLIKMTDEMNNMDNLEFVKVLIRTAIISPIMLFRKFSDE